MFLSKRNNGYYYIVYKNKTGIRTLKSTGTKKKSEAYRYLVDFEIRSKENNHISAILNFFELAIKFMRYSETVKSKLTCRDYNLTIKRFSNFIGKSKISEITRQIIQEYILDRIKTSSIYQGRKDLINIKAILSWAVKEKLLETNPSDNIKRIKVPEKLPVFFTRDEFSKLIETIDDSDLRDLVVVAVNTGMRQGELINLEWESVHIDQRLLILDNQYFINKSRRVRSIPFNDIVHEVFNRRYKSRKSKMVFTYQNQPIKQDFIVHKFKKYLRTAELREELKFHSLRHTFATWLVQKGVSIYQVSQLLGHADVTTTQIYAHLNTNDLRSAVQELNS